MPIDPDRLRRHVAELSRTPRPAGSRALDAAREYAARQLDEAGWSVEPFPFEVAADSGVKLHGTNLIAEHPEHPAGDGPQFCLGAHVDTVPNSPGADDNASAVAALLEIARLLPEMWPDDSRLDLELLVFDLEEVGMLGGAMHAELTKANGIDLRGMVSLEMLGYCDPRPGSQILPRGLQGLYPTTGDFIGAIGNQNSHALLERFCEGMRCAEGLPVESLIVPANGEYLQATRLSDHSPFWDAGYPALMITDTSFLRNPHYHTPGDTLETLDFNFLQKVATGCLEAVRHVLAAGL